MVKIEEGKYYLTRDGRRVGPIRGADYQGIGHRFLYEDTDAWRTVREDGTWSPVSGEVSEFDLVSEWTDGPVRTVTRKEVVGGEYGPVLVETDGAYVRLGFKTTGGIFPPTRSIFSTSELRQVASVLTQIADALDENEQETK